MEHPHEITRLLAAWRQGDARAGDEVFALLYGDLRAVARWHLARLHPGATLVPTVLIHEAYVKFAGRSAPRAADRRHFLAIASRAMRHVTVDYLRRRRASKRDGGVRVPLDSAVARADQPVVDVLAMDQALEELEALDTRQARVVDMRFFGGLDLAEIAGALGVSERTVKRDWHKARAFLAARLRPPDPDGPSSAPPADPVT